MFEIDFDFVACFDVDETLISWSAPSGTHDFELTHNGVTRTGKVLTRHVDRIIMHKFWGNGVVVWSKSGKSFAKAVIQKLKLEKYVDVVMAKSSFYYDDKKCEEFMGEHRFLYSSSNFSNILFKKTKK